MRSRNIKPGFFKNPELAELQPHARLLFIALWMLADSEGRLEDRPTKIKGECFAFEGVDCNSLLNELQAAGFIRRYKSEGVSCIWIIKFREHQRPHPKEPKSRLPCFSTAEPGKETASCSFPSDVLNADVLNAEDSSAAEAAASDEATDPDLRDWLVWWNTLKAAGLVLAGANVDEPSQGVLGGWKRVQKSARLRKLLADRDAIWREIQGSRFLREARWFDLEKLFGGKNREGSIVVERLLEGKYRDDAASSGGANGRKPSSRVGPGQRYRGD